MIDGMPESVSVGEFDERDDAAVRGVLRQIDGRAHAERQDDQPWRGSTM